MSVSDAAPSLPQRIRASAVAAHMAHDRTAELHKDRRRDALLYLAAFCMSNPHAPPEIVVGAVHGRRGTRAVAR